MGRIRKRRFYNGDEVEVTWDEEGFLGAWYEAKVLRIVPKTRRYCVVYDHLVAADDDGGGGGEDPRPLREMADFARVRPRPPRRGGPFVVNQPVDGWHKDGWWTGVVVAAPPDGEESRYTVCFPSPREQMEFPAADLRAHLEWVDDAWVRPDENTPVRRLSSLRHPRLPSPSCARPRPLKILICVMGIPDGSGSRAAAQKILRRVLMAPR